LRRAPGVGLRLTPLRFFLWVPADRGGIQKYLRAHETRDARGFGIPLVPTDQYPDRREPRAEYTKARRRTRFIVLIHLAGREIVLLVIERIVRDVHLAVHAEQRAVRIDHRGRVVVETGAALLERSEEHT